MKRPVLRALIAVTWISAMAPVPLLARQSTAADALSALRVGQVVRVEAPGLAIDGGAVVSIDGDGVVVGQQGQEWSIDPRTLERLEVRERSIMPSLLAFTGAGLVGGFLVDKMLTQVAPEKEYAHEALIGAGIGAALGLVNGLTRWRWQVTFPR